VLVDYVLDDSPQRRASRLLVTLHQGDLVLAQCPERVTAPTGTVELPAPKVEGELIVRASAYNVLRQRSDPLETTV
jgi:hypothetical protein